MTAALLAALGLAIAAAPAHAGELPVLQQAGGAVAPPAADSGSGGAVAPAGPAAQTQDGTAPGEAQAPASATATDAPASPADPGAPAQAPADPMPSATEEPAGQVDPQALTVGTPTAPEAAAPVGAPGNLSLNIRVLSPGDDGGVTQQIVSPEQAPSGPGRPAGDGTLQPPTGDWNWNWSWSCGSAGGSPAAIAASGSWNWNWSWDCSSPSTETPAVDKPGAVAGAVPESLSPKLPAVGTPPAEAGPRPGTLESGSGGSRAPATGFASARRIEAGVAGPIAPTAQPAARSRAVERPTPAGATDGGPSQLLLSQRLVGSAASTVPPPGGAPSLLLVALLGALSLLAPRAVEPAWMRARRLRSLTAGHRLERPG